MEVQVYLGISASYTRRKLLCALSNANAEEDKETSIYFHVNKYPCAHPPKSSTICYWLEYEDLDFQLLLNNALGISSVDQTLIANSYCFRKGLIRKAHLAFYINKYISKRNGSVLKRSFPETYFLDLPDVEYFDEAMNEIFEVEDYLRLNETKQLHEKTTFILKASLADKASELFLFNSREQLLDFFQSRFEDSEDGADLQYLREWVIQKYIDRPLLLNGGRKFHIRTYILAVGALKVYVYGGMLALFAKNPYDLGNLLDSYAHVTNTCIQSDQPDFDETSAVQDFWKLEGISVEKLTHIFNQIKLIVADTFEALINEAAVFQPLPNCFELYGLDFLVDEKYQVYLLEANAFPDFKQTGSELEELISLLFTEVIRTAVVPLLTKSDVKSKSNTSDPTRKLHLVYTSKMQRQ